LPERGCYEVCPVCWWEDDLEQAELPWAWGGANGISLVEAQQAYLRHGAMDADAVLKVRLPKADEARGQDWRPYDPRDGELHPLHTAEEEQQAEARGQAHWAAFQTGLRTLRTEEAGLSDEEIERRVREFSDALELHYGEAEVELLSQLIRDDQWPRKHPLQAFAWAWRNRRSASLPARLSQLSFAPLVD
jgi:Cysteine-rich CPCC